MHDPHWVHKQQAKAGTKEIDREATLPKKVEERRYGRKKSLSSK
jgi:hypothetical protein